MEMKFVQEVQISLLVLLISISLASPSSPLVLVSTSVSSSSSSSSSNNADVLPLDDSLAVEGKNVKIVRRIRVRTSTTPAPDSSTRDFDSGSGSVSGPDFTESPEIQEWFSLKHKEFERVKDGSGTSTTTTTNNESRATRQPAPASASTSRLLSEAEYVYEYSNTSKGPRVQVIYGDGKTPPPAGLMESPDMLELVREHLHESNTNTNVNANGVEPATVAVTETPTTQPPTATAAPLPPVQLQLQPISPQNGLIPPIYHVGGSPVAAVSESSAPPPGFFSPFHGAAYTPDTETKTYVSAAPPVFTQPTTVTMPAMHVPGVRATSAWRWPTYVEEQESIGGPPFKGFEYSFPPFTTSTSQRGPPPPSSSQGHSPNYYPADLPFSPYEEPIYTKPSVVQTKSRPDGSPNSIPWTPLPPSSPFGGTYHKMKTANSISDSQPTVAESSYSQGHGHGGRDRDRDMPPGSYSTLGKRMTAPDTRSPSAMGQYPDELPIHDSGAVPDSDSVIKESHFVNSVSSAPASASGPGGPEDFNYNYFTSYPGEGEGAIPSSEDEYSNYIIDAGPSFGPSPGQGPSYEGPSYYPAAPRPMTMPFPVKVYSHSRGPPPRSPPPESSNAMYTHYSSSSAFPPFMPMPVPMPQPPPSLPSFYSPSQNPTANPQKHHYKIMLIKPPSPPPESNLVYMLHEAPRTSSGSGTTAVSTAPPTAAAASSSTPQLYYVTSGSYNYKKRSASLPA